MHKFTKWHSFCLFPACRDLNRNQFVAYNLFLNFFFYSLYFCLVVVIVWLWYVLTLLWFAYECRDKTKCRRIAVLKFILRMYSLSKAIIIKAELLSFSLYCDTQWKKLLGCLFLWHSIPFTWRTQSRIQLHRVSSPKEGKCDCNTFKLFCMVIVYDSGGKRGLGSNEIEKNVWWTNAQHDVESHCVCGIGTKQPNRQNEGRRRKQQKNTHTQKKHIIVKL